MIMISDHLFGKSVFVMFYYSCMFCKSSLGVKTHLPYNSVGVLQLCANEQYTLQGNKSLSNIGFTALGKIQITMAHLFLILLVRRHTMS